MRFSYETMPQSSEERPYSGIEFNKFTEVPAVYTKNRNKEYNGNPLVEALPRPRNETEIADAYSRTLLSYDYEEVKDMEPYEKLGQIALLKVLRIRPTFARAIEDKFYMSQLISYGNRAPLQLPNAGRSVEGLENKPMDLVFAPGGSNPNEPITLLGYSGSGKSSAIEILLTDYPQVIRHSLEDVEFLQITYLYVECPVNSNMSALLYKIAEQLDKALKCGDSYQKAIKKCRTIGEKATLISNAFQAFSVGTLFIDEIQNIDFSLNKESTYGTLLTLSNETGVNLSVIGTEEAYNSMFESLKLLRRVGDPIIAHRYCSNKKYVSTVIKEISRYQWFDEYVPFTPQMIKMMAEYTGGIFDQIITLYIIMNIDYIEAPDGNKPVVNEAFIKKTSERHFPRIREILEELKGPESSKAEKKLKEYRDQSIEECNRIIENAKQEAEANKFIEEYESQEYVQKEDMLKNCRDNILLITDEFSEEEIEKEIKHQLRLKCNINADVKTISRLTFKALQEKKNGSNKAKRAKHDVTHESIGKYIKETEYTGTIKGIGGK